MTPLDPSQAGSPSSRPPRTPLRERVRPLFHRLSRTRSLQRLRESRTYRTARQRAWAYFSVLFGRGVPFKRRALYAVAGGVGLFAALGMWVFLYTLLLIPFTPAISDLRKAKAERPTVVLSADGEKLVEYKPFNREWVELEEISEHVVNGLIATEDHRFYEHFGLDVKRLLGSVYRTLLGNRQGGSTITQQLARNLYPDEIGREISLTRKLKEMITAFKIEYAYEKDEILETYLNTVPFNYNAYGIEMAAQTYFDKSAEDLSVLESATLVGMLKGTAYYNPVRRPERSIRRRNVVMSQMVKRGKLEPETYERLRDEPMDLDFERQPVQQSRAPHFTEHLRGWLLEWADRNGYNVYRDSLVVHTTLDTRMQRLAENAVDRWMPSLQAVADVEWSRATPVRLARSPGSYRSRHSESRAFDHFWESKPALVERFIRDTPQFASGVEAGVPEEQMVDSLRADEAFMAALKEVKTRLEAGLVALDPQTGYVKAWVGSREFEEDQYDHVVRARRQPGSTFKPIVYAAALEEGYTPEDTFMDEEVEIRLRNGEVWRPTNSGSVSGREVTLADALAYSKNTVTAQLIQEVGTGDVVRLARRMGINRSRLAQVPSIALGTSEATLLEMASVYATIASGGVYRRPVLVTRIEDRNGQVLADFETEERRVLSEEAAVALTDMMRGVVDRGTGRRVRTTFGIQADVAGKTGTTTDNADGWFMLMHPKLVAGAWVGFNDPRVSFRSDYWGQGGNNALFLVGEFYKQALSRKALGLGGAEFPEAPDSEDGGSFFIGFFREIGRVADAVGGAVGDVFGWLGGLIFGSGTGEDDIDPSTPAGEREIAAEETGDGEEEDVSDEISRDQQVADSLNRRERDNTRLERVLRELREQELRQTGENESASGDEGGEGEEESEESEQSGL